MNLRKIRWEKKGMWKKEKKINTTCRWCKLWIWVPSCDTPICHLPPCHTARYKNIMRTRTLTRHSLSRISISGISVSCYEYVTKYIQHWALEKNIICGLYGFWGSNSGEVECSGVVGCAIASHPARPKWRWCCGMCRCVTFRKTNVAFQLLVSLIFLCLRS